MNKAILERDKNGEQLKANNDSENRVGFVNSRSMSRGAPHMYCGFCDGGYQKWTYQYVVVISGIDAGSVICPDCLKSGIPGMQTPSYEEWLRGETEADKQYCHDYWFCH